MARHKFRKVSQCGSEFLADGRHRFEHWYRDNQVYFITARCRDRFPAFASERAKEIFWDRFLHYTREAKFQPWIVSLIDNHYHVLGYCEVGDNLGEMMRKLHGSTAKLVNDLLAERRLPFWHGPGDHDYFDGCLRDEIQLRRTYLYILRQAIRHGICSNWRDYPHTHVWLELEECERLAIERDALMRGVRYKRYDG
jgi:REP element-mobilizing transposase RayT